MSVKPIRVLHVIGIMNRGGAEAMIMNLYRQIDRDKIQFDFVENSFEEMLTILYGNYMKLPPESERVWKHKPLIIDFERNYEEMKNSNA